MIDGLRPWIENRSPTFDEGAVNRMMDLVQHDLAAWARGLNASRGVMGFGDSVAGHHAHPRAGEGYSALGHMGYGSSCPARCNKAAGGSGAKGGICYGPGLMGYEGRQTMSPRRVAQIAGPQGSKTPLPRTVLFNAGRKRLAHRRPVR